MKLAIVHRGKCKPTVCGRECKKYCPVEKKEADSCVVVGDKCSIDEHSCVGCGICVKRCPFGAIDVVNLPSVEEKDIVYRFGENGFALYGLPVPKEGFVLGLLGRNGIGKSTAVKILAGNLKVDGERFKGTEMQRYFDELVNKKISYKPQNLSMLSVDVVVMDLLLERCCVRNASCQKGKILELARKLNVENILGNKMDKLSGGELQRVAILAASLGDADIYFFDEPLAFLDIGERIRVSDFLKELSSGKTLIVVEHDLLILDYLTDYLNIFYGGQGSFGIVSGIKSSKEGVNAYLDGFLKEENMRIRDKVLNFNFTKNASLSGNKVASWDEFEIKFDSGFELKVKGGEIRKNHVVGILGKNGTGKTTFIKALVGELDKGCFGGVGFRGVGVSGDLGVSYKAQYLFSEDEKTVRDVLFRERVDKKMRSAFNLGVLESKRVCDLSGGELQRLSIARCLAKEADVYFIDEPSAYLDVEERIKVSKAIKDVMTEKERTAFVVDHDLLLVSYLADSVINFSGIGEGNNGTQMNADERREGGMKCFASEVRNFEEGVSELLKSLDITLRKDKESGRPRINKKGSVLDREQKLKNQWAIF